MDRPPFDTVKASFYLIAFVIVVHCVVVLVGAAACLSVFEQIVENKFKCDAQGRLGELLSGALAAALAFAGGFTRRDK
jgi:hypothetical protein